LDFHQNSKMLKKIILESLFHDLHDL
jgi:hypothetical protein